MALSLATQLYAGSGQAEREGFWKASLRLWAEDAANIGFGKKLELEKRPWLRELYDCEAQRIVVRKTPQVGVSTWAVLKCLHGARFRWPQGFAYYLPFDTHVGAFVRQKIDPIILSTEGLGGVTDNVGMKSVGSGFGFIRGIDSPVARQIISVDTLVRDERDHMDPEAVADIEGRLEGSDFKNIIDIGIPSVPGWGIDAEFQASTQKWWTLKCECGLAWTVEESWPSCVKGGKLVCPKCEKPEDIARGKWIARAPGPVEGFSINALMNPTANPSEHLARWDAATFRSLLTRTILGLPAKESGGVSLSAKELLAELPGNYDQEKEHKGPTFGGADVGGGPDTSPCVILEKPEKGTPRVIRLFRWSEWSELDEVMAKFHVERFVVDALPDVRAARAFCKRWKGRAFMCYYKPQKRGEARWDEAQGSVESDRTESLDASHEPLYTGGVELPSAEDPEVRRLAMECGNLRRVEKELPNGSVVAVWEKLGPDHYRHALNYAWLALRYNRPKMVAEMVGPPTVPDLLKGRRPMYL